MEIVCESEVIKSCYEIAVNATEVDSAHDMSHILRVLGNARKIGNIEGADLEILSIAALLHDIKNYPKGHPEAKKSSLRSAEYARDHLEDLGYPEEKIAIVFDAILNHSYSRGQVPETLEGKVLQDADRLDALGAIGLYRCFAVGASSGRPFYCWEDPFAENGRDLDDKTYSLDHFYQKLFRLPELMQTETGRCIAEQRVAFMQSYVDQLAHEV